MDTRHRLPRWAAELFANWAFYLYVAIYGGRGSSKTRSVGRYLPYRVYDAWDRERRPLRIIVARDFAKDVPESALKAFRDACDAWVPERAHEWDHQENKSTHLPSGSQVFFRGLVLNPRRSKGWEDIDILWIEEGETLRQEVWEVVEPTIMRNKGAQIICTWNPMSRSETLWRRFVLHPRRSDLVLKVNYTQNPYMTAEALSTIAYDQAVNPHRFQHIWMGEPDDDDGDEKVLPFSLVLECVRAWEAGLHHEGDHLDAPIDAGLDIADGGADKNAFVVRKGPVVLAQTQWRSAKTGYLAPTARRAIKLGRHLNVQQVYYDRTGVGSPMRGEFSRLHGEHTLPFATQGVGMGDKVAGENRYYDHNRLNPEVFARRNSQLAWALRLRANRTHALREGENVEPWRCLFINKDMPGLQDYMADLAQPIWRHNITGKIEIDKTEGKLKSPDLFDATSFCFSRDSIRGLRAR